MYSSSRPGERAESDLRARVKGLQSYEAGAWRDFVNDYHRLIEHWCQRARIPRQDIEDVVESAFLRVLQNVNRFQPNGGPHCLEAWLKTVAKALSSIILARSSHA